ILLYIPGGFTQVVYWTRDQLLQRVERRLGPAPAKATVEPPTSLARAVPTGAVGVNGDGSALQAVGLPVTFGGVVAVNDVDCRRHAEAAELIDFLGLGRYADRFIAELSTGTRRIVELAALLAVAPRVICLDEPTAGVAQREAEAFGPLIKRLQAELSATLVVVEHDLPLILAITDHVYCLEAGSVIAQGPPEEIRTDPLVIASYLGTDERATMRSNATLAD